jgi:putative ABC transport system permease protein
MGTIVQDVKYALRQLGRQPSFSVLAVLTLGIGVSTALFSIISG